MATFPSLTPNARTLGLGDYPQLLHTSSSGVSVRFLQGTKRVQQTLSLEYRALPEASINSIYDHYAAQEGTLIPFALPSEVWAGYSSVPISAVDYQWRYADAFSVEPIGQNRFNVTIELVSELI